MTPQDKTTLSEADKLILQSYSSSIDGLAAYLGGAFEIVLHNLADLEHSIIKIVNGSHSGRCEGAPITDYALSVLERIRQENSLAYTTYISSSKYGHPVRSTTIVIFGEKRQAIGLLCINLYMDSPISELAQVFNSSADSPLEHINENFISNSDELITRALEKATEAVMADNTIQPAAKHKEIITLLYYQGVFKMKEAVPTVANGLGISRNTVYLHLRSLEKKT
jgi:predicted transcriptional regulator YheO